MYIFFTNISEDTTFLLQGVTYWVRVLYYDVNKEQRAIWYYKMKCENLNKKKVNVKENRKPLK